MKVHARGTTAILALVKSPSGAARVRRVLAKYGRTKLYHVPDSHAGSIADELEEQLRCERIQRRHAFKYLARNALEDRYGQHRADVEVMRRCEFAIVLYGRVDSMWRRATYGMSHDEVFDLLQGRY